ncbi:long-chain fatty acid--CoA ligase [Skermania sp. ID1734]|uniref:long-chain-fatty-acid--CoA ligase n=1 Tax=Skermania sp. ID1734 TaxID=2597516 RepID=UPI00117DF711|nr:long-chain-fatty-acid--CoA ligase [Skermania sp. ID1734]TSE01592.1 long-chain fatty acid--CoA ligase [Skermania sp. ID1734]
MNPELVKGRPSTSGDGYPLNTTTLIRHAARTSPEQEIVFRTSDGRWDRYTYADAYSRIVRSANALRDLGIQPGDVVGVLDWNSRRHFELYWSIPGTAAAMLQMNLRLGEEDLGFVVRHSGTSWILVEETLLAVAEKIAPTVPDVRWVIMTDKPLEQVETSLPDPLHYEDLLAAASTEADWPMIDETSAYSACYTTGTTGRPKGVYYSHRCIYLHTMTMVAELGISAYDSVMLITPMFHANCWGLPQAAVQARAKVVLPGRYAAGELSPLVDAIIEETVTVANGAPAIFGPMLDYIKTLETKPDLSRARFLSGASEPPLSLMRGYAELTGADIIHAYGATETTPLVSVNRGIKPSLAQLPEEEKWDRKRSQGVMLTGVDFRLVDGEDRDVPFDGKAQGELLMRGPWITASYHDLNEPERFHEGYWRSGDVATIDTFGYLKIVDRIKDVIKSGGEWISSIDMENALTSHPLVREAAVIGVPHPKWQERPIAVVVTDGGVELPLSEIKDVLAPQFATWQMPDKVLFVDSLARTSVGKLDKKVMRESYKDVYAD